MCRFFYQDAEYRQHASKMQDCAENVIQQAVDHAGLSLPAEPDLEAAKNFLDQQTTDMSDDDESEKEVQTKSKKQGTSKTLAATRPRRQKRKADNADEFEYEDTNRPKEKRSRKTKK